MPASSIAVRWQVVLAVALALAVSTTDPARAEPASACGAAATPVHAIQGVGRSSPLRGLEVTVEAVVVASFPGLPRGLGGFFLQEEDADADADPRTSEGLFVFDEGLGADLVPGERVRTTGRVSEFFGLTELSQLRALETCPPGGRASALEIQLPVDSPDAWERWEGMRVRLEQPLRVTGHADLVRHGELELAAGARLWQPTHREAPGAAANELEQRNARRRILLDDGSDSLNPDPPPYLWRNDGGSLRLQDRLHRLEGVLDYAFGRFRIHPTAPVAFEPGEPRPRHPPVVPGTLRVVAWNVHDHFNGDGRGGGFPTRGASDPAELERQRAKLVATLVALEPDVALLSELENDGVGPDSALTQLSRSLSRAAPGAPYLPVDPGQTRLGGQAIAVGMLYRPSAVFPLPQPM